MGKKKIHSYQFPMNDTANFNAFSTEKFHNHYQYDEDKNNKGSILKNEPSVNEFWKRYGLICILIAIIILLVNLLYLNNKKPSYIEYSNIKSSQIINYEHVTFPTVYDNSQMKQKSHSELSKNVKNENIETTSDFNMIVFNDEENQNETHQGKYI